MKSSQNHTELRKKAEKRIKNHANPPSVPSAVNPDATVHELDVHREELIIQTENLLEKQKELEAAVKKYADLYNNSPAAHITTDNAGMITDANLTASEMLAIPVKRIVGRGFSRFIHMGDHEAYFKIIQQLAVRQGSKKKGCGELRLLADKKLTIPVYLEIVPRFDNNGKLSGWDIAFMDISAQKEAETALHQSEGKYRNVFETAMDGLIIQDLETGKIVDVNQSACKMYGYTRTQLLELQYADLISRPAEGALKTKDKQTEYHHKKNGTVFPVEISYSRYFKNGKKLVTEFIRDVSETINAREVLERAYGKLEESRNQLKDLSSRLIEIQETERRKIARELHDSTGQTLAALKFSIESALRSAREHGSVNGIKILEKLIPDVQQAIHAVRSIYMGLRPTVLDDLGILAAIPWLCREFEKTYPEFTVNIDVGLTEEDVPEKLKIVIFRIIQEAFHNIARHSNATKISLSLIKQDKEIELAIQDDGVGFLEKQMPGTGNENRKIGSGIAGMRERADISGGVFTIETFPGKGTLVRVKWKTGVGE